MIRIRFYVVCCGDHRYAIIVRLRLRLPTMQYTTTYLYSSRRTRRNPKENFHKMGQQTFEKGKLIVQCAIVVLPFLSHLMWRHFQWFFFLLVLMWLPYSISCVLAIDSDTVFRFLFLYFFRILVCNSICLCSFFEIRYIWEWTGAWSISNFSVDGLDSILSNSKWRTSLASRKYIDFNYCAVWCA